MKRWMEYLRFRRGTLGLIGLLTGIYWVMFILYQIPAEPVLYGFAIWLLAAGGPAIWDYLKFSKKHRTLLEVACGPKLAWKIFRRRPTAWNRTIRTWWPGCFRPNVKRSLNFPESTGI